MTYPGFTPVLLIFSSLPIPRHTEVVDLKSDGELADTRKPLRGQTAAWAS